MELNTDEVDDSTAADETTTDVIRSEIFDNGATQTISAPSFNVNDKSSDSIVSSSDSSDSEDSSNCSEERANMQNHSELPSQLTSHLDNDDSSKQLLISDESSNQQEADNADDQPVTTDLTLTKTVELTENDPDPEPEIDVEPAAEPESEQRTFNVVKFEIPQPIEMVRQIEEPNDIKEMSLNNFESTMDDISDNELESLEQELEDLVALTDQNADKASDSALKALEDSLEKTAEAKEETAAVMKTVDPVSSAQEVVEHVIEKLEEKRDKALSEQSTIDQVVPIEQIVITEPVDEPSIQEVSIVSDTDDDQKESSVSEAQEAVEPAKFEDAITPTDPDPALSTSSTDESTSIQNLPSQSNEDFSMNESNSTGSLTSAPDLGRVPPYWIPDNLTNQCMQCDIKFSLIKRRHHCRACGLLLCSGCCNEKFHLHYLGAEGRICGSCHDTLLKAQQQQLNQPRNPNPANPMEYCSTLPPQQQVNADSVQPPTVMVPSGVLKRGPRTSERKSVIFSDGIRPGSDLDEPAGSVASRVVPEKLPKFNMPTINEKTNSFIPETANELPPVLMKESEFKFVDNNLPLLQRLRQEELKFAINKNFYVTVKIVTRKSLNLNTNFL